MARKYDTTGRDMLKKLCKGRGADIGCNQQKIAPNCIGVDIEPEHKPDILADFNNLPFDDNELDFVVASHVIEHAYSVVQTLREWVRVVKHGGSIGVIVPHGEYASTATLGDANGTHHQLFTPKTLEIYFRYVGLKDVEVIEYRRPYAYKQTPGLFATGTKK